MSLLTRSVILVTILLLVLDLANHAEGRSAKSRSRKSEESGEDSPENISNESESSEEESGSVEKGHHRKHGSRGQSSKNHHKQDSHHSKSSKKSDKKSKHGSDKLYNTLTSVADQLVGKDGVLSEMVSKAVGRKVDVSHVLGRVFAIAKDKLSGVTQQIKGRAAAFMKAASKDKGRSSRRHEDDDDESGEVEQLSDIVADQKERVEADE